MRKGGGTYCALILIFAVAQMLTWHVLAMWFILPVLLTGALIWAGTRIRPGPVPQRTSRSFPQSVKVAVAARDGGCCRTCGSRKDIQFDHIVPWSRGGQSTLENCQLLCGRHNRAKSDRMIR